MIFRSVILACILAASSAKLFVQNEVHLKYMWESYKFEWNKKYDAVGEETQRYANFIANLKIADERNALEKSANGTAVHGVTRFSDLSQEEFASRYLKSDPSLREKNVNRIVLDKAPQSDLGLVDWTGIYTTAVKDQGYCGSCWAFSATEQIESDTIRTLGTTFILSPEQIVQCDKTSYGCSGGWTERAYSYVQRTGGIEQNADYPYSSYYGVTGSCSVDTSSFAVTVSGYTTINGESSMAAYVQSTGPLSVCVDASSWNSYTGGIMSSCGTSVDHCVQAVGVDTSSYWKVRNSWGTSWGESGYIRLAYGANTCDITNDPTYVSVSLV